MAATTLHCVSAFVLQLERTHCCLEISEIYNWLGPPEFWDLFSPSYRPSNQLSSTILNNNTSNLYNLNTNQTLSSINMSDNNTSTLKSYVDSAAGAVQSVVGNVLGTSGDQAEGKAKQQKADAEYDASHATVKLPGVTATSSGVAKDDPDRAAGSWNQTIGSAKEFAGGLVGSENLKQAGRQQNLEGQEQEAKGQLSDYASGAADRVAGTLGGAVAGVTGDRTKQAEYEAKHDTGKTQQRGAEYDIKKQAEAQQ
ncbi:hypothetical protein QBC47DRAFT_394826 [Echria macrotheca]|uniref:CsbD-like domain-containing protein n=1 Tax=Echria macrotheca TaxID=438768 RepID=A0AAJ0F1F6_9PEZI|nr:hypothetical protein QBC47DRAFT_394826 [Echria macrotheca]